MKNLENRIPPPLVLVIILVLMKIIAMVDSNKWQSLNLNLLAALLAILGVACAVAGVAGFRKAKTTVNPLDPSRASSLVTGGIYNFSRNPMYLGMLMVTIGFGIHLASLLSFIMVILFAMFISRFQIVPEERAMKKIFGAEFTEFCLETRRWL
ncbi:MAG: protein-S-isoprenylcysteine O-methyltransferase Ste14 [Cryomorphaceae bacterium]|jgi:protein-S-isoprenylcysteine O-methyltransferase Ste14